MANAIVIFLFAALLLVKGGTDTATFLAWSGVASITAIFLQILAMKSSIFVSIKLDSFLNKPFLQSVLRYPVLLLLMLQCWFVLQVVFGITQDSQVSIDEILLGVGFLSFLVVLASFNWNRRAMKQLFFSLFAIAAIQAVYGMWVFLTQTNVILWIEKIHYLDKPTGTLVNANHFAAYLSLVLVLMFSFAACKLQEKTAHQSVKQLTFKLFEQLYSIYTVCAMLFIVTILTTRSFGGISSLFLTAIVALVVSFRHKASRQNLFLLFIIASATLVFIVLLITLSDYAILQKEFSSIAFTIERRIEISQAGVRMMADNWLFGVGAGGFYSSFSQYRDLTVGNSFYHFAHNDYLQFWAEYGLIGIVFAVAFVSTCLRFNWQVLQVSKNIYRRSFAYASFYGTMLLGLHSLVDFPLQVPAYALLYLTILCFNVMTYKDKIHRYKIPEVVEQEAVE